MLRFEEVTAGYGSGPVLSNVSLDVDRGGRIAVIGRNGVGKTTLLRCLIGHVLPSRGRVFLDAKDITDMPTHQRARRGIAYVPQGRDIFPSLSVLDNLRVAGYASRSVNWEVNLEGVLEEFPLLRDKAKTAGGGLSGGQQQILALGRALMTEPSLLLLDEPSEGIQPSIVDQIAEHVRRVNEERGITIVLVEQNLDFASQIADVACVMDKGQIVRQLPMDEILSNADLQHEYLGV